jgi:N-acyl-D-aspartate/D-glutamate deacylase
MYDLLIRNARVVDGTGAPAREADLAVTDGRIAAIGALKAPAHRTLDADGQVLAPGFVDTHTHYDAQLFWDPTISPSCHHGVTTVVAGNCGFSIAPLSEDAAPYLRRMLARVEGMPEVSLEMGVPWDWRSFGEFLDRAEGRIGVNMGFLCGHSALRRVVMGERAQHAEASGEELQRMKAVLAASLREGALGFSSSVSSTHNDAEGHPVPSRLASREELVALARVVRDHPGTILELLPGVEQFGEHEMGLMTEMSLAAQRSLNWNAVVVGPGNEAFLANQMSASDYARKAGAEVVALVMVATPTVRLNFRSGFLLDSFEGWAELFELSIPDRIAYLKDPARRAALDRGATAGAGPLRNMANWANHVVADSTNKAVVGRRIGDIAQERGVTPFDALVDITIADELATVFLAPHAAETDEIWARRAALWRDDRAIVGASDAGAHLDMIDAFSYSTQLLAAARNHGVITLEDAVHRLTQAPARLIGLKDRGLLREGWRADLVLFDPGTVGPARTETRYDLPGDEMRLYAGAVGMSHVIVNGRTIVEQGAHTGELPGHVLRSGRDTATAAFPARRLETA